MTVPLGMAIVITQPQRRGVVGLALVVLIIAVVVSVSGDDDGVQDSATQRSEIAVESELPTSVTTPGSLASRSAGSSRSP